MNTPHKIIVTLAAAALAATLAGCSVDTADTAAAPVATTAAPAPTTAAPSPTTEAEQAWPTDAELAAVSDEGSMTEVPASAACEVYLERMDRGPRQGARGEVAATDADGLATVYTVVDGDNLERIADRFCFTWEGMYDLHPSKTTMTPGLSLSLTEASS